MARTSAQDVDGQLANKRKSKLTLRARNYVKARRVKKKTHEAATMLKTQQATSLSASSLTSKFQELCHVIPGLTRTRLLTLSSDTLIELCQDTAAVATRVVELRSEFPSINMQNLLLQWPELLTSKRKSFLLGHTSTVNCVAITPDSHVAVSGDNEGKLLLWDLVQRRSVGELVGHTDMVLAVAISPDGKHAASSSTDNTVLVWNLQTLICERVLTGSSNWVVALAFAPDGRNLLSGGYCEEAPLRLWDISTGAFNVLRLPAPSSDGLTDSLLPQKSVERVCSVSITHDGRQAVSGGDTVVLWDIASQQPMTVLDRQTDRVWCTAIAPHGKLAVTGGADAVIRLWDLQAMSCIAELRGHKDQVHAAAISQDGRFAFSGGNEALIYKWDLQSKVHVISMKCHSQQILCMAVSPDGCLLVSSGADQLLRVTDITLGTTDPVKKDE